MLKIYDLFQNIKRHLQQNSLVTNHQSSVVA